MKASVETLGATRVKLNVEVPFEELRPSVDAAYKRVARQVRVQGFRPGKVPPRILDQRVGRAAILEEALQDAVPRFYADAVEETQLRVAGRPEVELDSFGDGAPLVFSATVDVRPEIEVPDWDGLPVTVDAVEVTDEDVDSQLAGLQDRFAVLTGVDRPVQAGDYVLLDIHATRDGEPVPGSEASGLSYEVGTGGLVPGLDEAITGASAGESRTFDAEIAFGELAGTTATFHVTVTAVKVKEVPPLDDDFATTASEFDTLAELRADVRARIERMRRMEQAVQARDRVLDVLLERVEIPLPESMVEEEFEWRRSRVDEQLREAGLDRAAFLAQSGRTEEELEAELREAAAQSVKAQLVLDAVGAKEELGVNEAELSDQVVRRAMRAGVAPNEFAERLVRQGQLPALMGEIVRGKALAAVLEAARITDSAGDPVDLGDLREDADGVPGVAASSLDADPGHDHDHEGHDHDHEGHDHDH